MNKAEISLTVKAIPKYKGTPSLGDLQYSFEICTDDVFLVEKEFLSCEPTTNAEGKNYFYLIFRLALELEDEIDIWDIVREMNVKITSSEFTECELIDYELLSYNGS